MFTLDELDLLRELLSKAVVPITRAKIAGALLDKVASEIARLEKEPKNGP